MGYSRQTLKEETKYKHFTCFELKYCLKVNFPFLSFFFFCLKIIMEREDNTASQISTKSIFQLWGGGMAKMLDCSLEVNEFKLQSCYYFHFHTNLYLCEMYAPPPPPPPPPAIG